MRTQYPQYRPPQMPADKEVIILGNNKEIECSKEVKEMAMKRPSEEKRKAGILSEGPTPEQQTTGEGKAQHLLGVKVSEVE